MSIRNSAKAIIIRNNHLLLLECQGDTADDIYYIFPGGGQEHGETLIEAVKRECWEEINCEVEVGKLSLIREYIGNNHEFAVQDKDVHAMEFYFLCQVKAGQEPKMGKQPDTRQIAVRWLELSELTNYAIYPKAFQPLMLGDLEAEDTRYLGDVN